MTRIMGILNVTPDSFADGGRWMGVAAAVARAERMLAEGADIIDVGGESTRPGAAPVPEDEELRRVLPVVEALAHRCVVSVDTRKAAVARCCVDAGAQIINDVAGLLWTVAADHGVGWVVMHMQGQPQTMQHRPAYDDVVGEVGGYLLERAREARAAGVPQVWVDPGIGFGKNLDHNVELLRTLPGLAAHFPVLVGASRKSFIHQISPAPDPADRLPGSLVVAVHAVLGGVEILRVHDVAATVQAIRVAQALTPWPTGAGRRPTGSAGS
ncbi:dihydropteroate synthase [Micromonospora sp. LOL_024]|uniref:dihydropteroate synthase n=1 Tax=Micromonospora sp. LOL_024 TaxID=3345412 RepID=UPI003A89855F